MNDAKKTIMKIIRLIQYKQWIYVYTLHGMQYLHLINILQQNGIFSEQFKFIRRIHRFNEIECIKNSKPIHILKFGDYHLRNDYKQFSEFEHEENLIGLSGKPAINFLTINREDL